MLYMNVFFKTKEQAKKYSKKYGGAVYSNDKYSKTKQSYKTEAMMTGRSKIYCDNHPYCVAWNVPEDSKKKRDKYYLNKFYKNLK